MWDRHPDLRGMPEKFGADQHGCAEVSIAGAPACRGTRFALSSCMNS
jgi:hypothetical protein